MESPAIDATPSGILFADWIASRGCSQSTAYRMRGELGITAEKRRRGTALEVWLSAADQALITAYADALGEGMSRAEALATVGRSGAMVPAAAAPMVPMESDGTVPLDPMDSDGEAAAAADALLQRARRRLAALRDAVDLGAPLSTAEVTVLLGARPGGAEVTRGRLRAVRQRRNVWTIEPD